MTPAALRENAVFSAVLLLALALSAWLYWPGLEGPSLLDDNVNLRSLEFLETGESSLEAVVRGNAAGPLGRPVSMLSFAWEKLYFDGGVRGTKRTNLILHLITGALLALFAFDVLKALGYTGPLTGALFAAAIWLFSPLLVSTVLYSIQRMAQLATLFTLLGLWAYLRLRLTAGWRWPWALCLLGSLAAAPLSKENGLLLVPLILLLEALVLQYRSATLAGTTRLKRWHGAVLGIGLLVVALAYLLYPEGFLAGYARRDFTLSERLLTQGRILWTYIAQFFWAQEAQLGIYQDQLVISTGLFSPRSTAWALLGWGAVLAVLLMLRGPDFTGLRFGVGFYLLAHTMESTLFPLEMYFEHRNYLPGMGLAIAVVSAAAVACRWRDWLQPWLLLAGLLLVGRNALVTASEAQIWSNQWLFHLVAINRFPESVRANSEMARTLAVGGDLDSALSYSDKVRRLDPEGPLRHQLRDAALYCLARPAIDRTFLETLSASPEDFALDDLSEKFYLLVKQVMEGRCPETDRQLLSKKLGELVAVADARVVAPAVWLSLAVYENELENYDRALGYVDTLILRSPQHAQAHLMRLYFLSQLVGEEYRNSDSLPLLLDLQRAGRLTPGQEETLALFVD